MFEYWFHGLDDGDTVKGTFTHHGTTHDFLEVVSQIAIFYNATIAGNFTKELLVEHDKKLTFLRVTDWKFEFKIYPYETSKIILHKLR